MATSDGEAFADISGRSSAEILERADRLARLLAKANGIELVATLPVYHPSASVRARSYWALAKIVFEDLTATDLEDCLIDVSE